jgi:hypothetical protein
MYVIHVLRYVFLMTYLTKDDPIAKKGAKKTVHKATEVCFAFELHSESRLAEFTESALHCGTINLEHSGFANS